MNVRIDVSDADLDPEQLDQATGRLTGELGDLDGAEVRRVAAAPESARGTGLEIAALVVAILDHHALAALVGTVRHWLRAHPSRKVTLELDGDKLVIDGATEAEARGLIDAWLARHGATG